MYDINNLMNSILSLWIQLLLSLSVETIVSDSNFITYEIWILDLILTPIELMADWWFTLWQSLELILVISSIRFLLFIPFPFKLQVNNFSMRILKGFMNLHLMFCDFFIESELIFYNDSSLLKCFPYCIQAIFTSRVLWLENYYEYAISEKLLTSSFFFFFLLCWQGTAC